MTYQDSDSSASDNPVIEVTETKRATVDAESDIHRKPWYEEIRQLKLSEKPSTNQRKAIVMALWFRHMDILPPAIANLNMDAYFDYYNFTTIVAADACNNRYRDKTHTAFIDIAVQLEQSVRREIDWTAISDRQDMAHETILQYIIRAFTMADVRMEDPPPMWKGAQSVTWKTGYLCSSLKSGFNPEPELRHFHCSLGKDFTARNISQEAGLHIVWTHNILDHLRLTDGDTTLKIFHYVSFLTIQRQTRYSVLPSDVIVELLHTLALFFPESDPETQQWLQTQFLEDPYTCRIDRNLAKCGDLRPEERRFNHFIYYRDRLVMLKELVDQLAPMHSTAMRILRDRRNIDQWFNFWVALVVIGMTLLFGLIQSIEGGIQVYKSYHPTPAQK